MPKASEYDDLVEKAARRRGDHGITGQEVCLLFGCSRHTAKYVLERLASKGLLKSIGVDQTRGRYQTVYVIKKDGEDGRV